jgi:hypothetical protein
MFFFTQAVAGQSKSNAEISCALAGSSRTVTLLRNSQIADSFIYKIRHTQKTNYLYDDADSSRGSNVQWQCIPDQNNSNLFVVSGEFTSNFLQGALFYFDSADGRIERINFAERNRPRWIKFSKQGAQVIFENTGNESSHKYLSYGKNGAHLEFDEIPAVSSGNGERLIELKSF